MGHWCSSTQEVPCGIDKWNNRTLSASQLDCTPCAPFSSTNGNDRAKSVDACVCEPGYYNNATSLLHGAAPACAQCFVGTDCPLKNTTRLTLPLKRGFWRVSNTSLDVRRCPDAAANCSRTGEAVCPHSTSGCRGGHDARRSCAPSLDGPLCLLCANRSHYYNKASATREARCSSCGDVVGRTLGAYAAILAGVLVVMGVLIRCGTHDKWTRFLRATRPEAKIKIVWSFCFCTVARTLGEQVGAELLVRSRLCVNRRDSHQDG
jgi:ribosomal protein S27E